MSKGSSLSLVGQQPPIMAHLKDKMSILSRL